MQPELQQLAASDRVEQEAEFSTSGRPSTFGVILRRPKPKATSAPQEDIYVCVIITDIIVVMQPELQQLATLDRVEQEAGFSSSGRPSTFGVVLRRPKPKATSAPQEDISVCACYINFNRKRYNFLI